VGGKFGMVSHRDSEIRHFFEGTKREVRHFAGTYGTYTQRILPLLPSSLVREVVLRGLRWRSGA
jgi:hypothetical protein